MPANCLAVTYWCPMYFPGTAATMTTAVLPGGSRREQRHRMPRFRERAGIGRRDAIVSC